jgi:CheY-like chemotaxis protein/signal transduction histidine kinase
MGSHEDQVETNAEVSEEILEDSVVPESADAERSELEAEPDVDVDVETPSEERTAGAAPEIASEPAAEVEADAEEKFVAEDEPMAEIEPESETEPDPEAEQEPVADASVELPAAVETLVTEGLAVGLFQLNSEGRLTHANAPFLSMFNVADEEGFSIEVATPKEGELPAARHFMETLAGAASEGGANGLQLDYPDPQQNTILHVWLTPVGDFWNGCVTATEKPDAVAAGNHAVNSAVIGKLDTSQAELLSVIAQKIRTPIDGIIGMADYLEGTDLEPEQLRFTSVIRQGAENLVAVIDDILDFSRAENGTLDLEPVETDLHGLVEGVIELHAAQARDKMLQIGVAIDGNVPRNVMVDDTRLRQVLNTIFGNAIKHTAAGGILLELAELERIGDSAQLRFTISDTGDGIASEKQSDIFNGLAMSRGRRKNESGGAGLDLPISRAIIEQLGGEIKLHSVPSEGTTFAIELTLDVTADEGFGEREREFAVLSGRRVLAVDDSAINRMVLARQLESLGMRPTIVPSAPEALHALTQAREIGDPFEIAILDHFMAGIDGVDLCVRIREMAGFADMKVILASAAEPMDADRKLPANGFDALMSKPLRPAATKAALRGLYGEGPANANVRSLGVQYQTASAAAETKPNMVRDSARRETVREQAAMLMEMFGTPTDEAVEENSNGQTEKTLTKDRNEPVQPAGVPSGKPRVLVAEDNHVNQQLAELILVTNGYDVRIVEDGVKAVEALQEEEFDLVLMDIQMPNMDGLDATREIRKLEGAAAATPVIALTANVMPGDADICFEAGMDSYVAKPVRQDLLLEEMRKFLSPEKKYSVVA